MAENTWPADSAGTMGAYEVVVVVVEVMVSVTHRRLFFHPPPQALAGSTATGDFIIQTGVAALVVAAIERQK